MCPCFSCKAKHAPAFGKLRTEHEALQAAVRQHDLHHAQLLTLAGSQRRLDWCILTH